MPQFTEVSIIAQYRNYSKEFKLQAAKLVTEQGRLCSSAARRLERRFKKRIAVEWLPAYAPELIQTSRFGTKPSMSIWLTLFPTMCSIWPRQFASFCEKAGPNSLCCVRSSNMPNYPYEIFSHLFNGQQ